MPVFFEPSTIHFTPVLLSTRSNHSTNFLLVAPLFFSIVLPSMWVFLIYYSVLPGFERSVVEIIWCVFLWDLLLLLSFIFFRYTHHFRFVAIFASLVWTYHNISSFFIYNEECFIWTCHTIFNIFLKGIYRHIRYITKCFSKSFSLLSQKYVFCVSTTSSNLGLLRTKLPDEKLLI